MGVNALVQSNKKQESIAESQTPLTHDRPLSPNMELSNPSLQIGTFIPAKVLSQGTNSNLVEVRSGASAFRAVWVGARRNPALWPSKVQGLQGRLKQRRREFEWLTPNHRNSWPLSFRQLLWGLRDQICRTSEVRA